MLACSADGRLVRKVRLPQTRSDDGTAQDAITMRGSIDDDDREVCGKK